MAPNLLLSQRAGTALRDLAAAAADAAARSLALEDACARYPERPLLPMPPRAPEPLEGARRRARGAFGFPADPRDLLAAVDALEALDDAIERAAMMLAVARPGALPEIARAQAATLVRAAARTADAAERLARRRDPGAGVADVRAMERDGDRLRRDALGALFASGLPPLEIVRLKAIHEALEDAIDAARDAAGRLGTLALGIGR